MASRLMAFAFAFTQTDGLFLKTPSTGHKDCPCVTMPEKPGGTWPTGNKKNGTTVEYSADTGSNCQDWDKQHDDACKGDDAPSWCADKWCWVDPCSCGIVPEPKRSSYFPNARKDGKPVYYSYATCGATDSFTADNHRNACPNLKTEDDCGKAKNSDDTQACHWNKDGKCIGFELKGKC